MPSDNAPYAAQRRRAIHLAAPGSSRTLCGRGSKAHLPHHTTWRRCKLCAAAARKLGPYHVITYYHPDGWSIPTASTSTTVSSSTVILRWAS